MAAPFDPKPGDVIRYEYLWRRLALDGRTAGDKDRPACIILTITEDDRVKRVMILPITHAPPKQTEPAYRMPLALKQHLGLDDAESWIMLSEANLDIWPSPDCLPVPLRGGGFTYGRLPQKLVAQMHRVIMAAITERRLDVTDREADDPSQAADLSDFQKLVKPPGQ